MTAPSTASVSIEDHLHRILAGVAPLGTETVGLSEARGRVLAEEIFATVSVPGFDNSAMDGYAVRRADVEAASPENPVPLTVVAQLPAGSTQDPPLAPGQAARIMTGAPVPSSADAVIAQEGTDGGRQTVLIRQPPNARGNIRTLGSDVRAGEPVLQPGRRLEAADIAAAAAVGVRTLRVFRAPRIAVLSTGDELVPPGEKLLRGQIHDSNSYLFEAAVAAAGGIPVRVGAIPDDVHKLHEVFDGLAGTVDAFITSGGVSVGDYDVVKAMLRETGSVWFGVVRMRPGKPQGFGHWADGTPIISLPGTPVGVFVAFETFVRPALRKMQGYAELGRPVVRAVAAQGWRSPAGRAQRMPIAVVGREPGSSGREALLIRPAAAGGASSHLVASLAGADGIALVPEEATAVDEGSAVDVILTRTR